MLSTARIAAALHSKIESDACTVTVEFKLPVFLPSTVQLNYDMKDKEIEFDLRDEAGIKPHLKGSIKAL